jgi:hypothetical protein
MMDRLLVLCLPPFVIALQMFALRLSPIKLYRLITSYKGVLK